MEKQQEEMKKELEKKQREEAIADSIKNALEQADSTKQD